MSFIITLLYFICFTATLVVISKKRFSKCLPLSFMISSFTLFFSQVVFKTFNIGIFINIIIAFIFPIICITKKIRNESLEQIKQLIINNGLYIFILLYIGVFIFDLNREFSMWDEFSHWGVMVKEMFRLDRFYSIDASTLMVHKDYPPIVSIYELFFAKLSGGYNETYLIRGLHLFQFSLFIPFIAKEDDKKASRIIKALLVIIIVYLLYLLFDCHGVINTIYTDYFMAMLVAYLLGMIYVERDVISPFNLFRVSLGLSFLLLTKQMGLPLYAMVVYYFIFSIVFSKVSTNHPIRKIIIVLVSLILPLTFYTGWNNYVDNLEVTRQFDIDNIEYKKLENYQKETYSNFIEASKYESLISSPIKVSYLAFIIIIFVGLLLLTYFNRRNISVHKTINLNIALTFVSIGYALVMLFLYIYSFGNVEGPMLSSFDRYMPTFILISLTTLLIVINRITDRLNNKKEVIVFGSILLLLLVIQNPKNYVKVIPAIRESKMSVYKKCANDLINNDVLGKRIFIIAQDSEGEFQYRVKYYTGNIITNQSNFDWDNDILYYKNIKDYVNEFDYIYLAQINEKFNDTFDEVFDDIKPYGLYKINKGEYKLLN